MQYFVRVVAMAIRTSAQNNQSVDFATLGWCSLPTLISRNHLVRVVSGCLRLLSGAPDALTHPMRSAPRFRGLLLLVRSSSCPQVKCKTFSWCLPNLDQFQALQAPQSPVRCRQSPVRCRPPFGNGTLLIWMQSHEAVDETLGVNTRSLLGTNHPKF